MFTRTATALARLLALLAIVTVPSHADASIRRFTQEELCELANLVVVGTVQSRESMWLDASQTTIVTRVTLSVDHVITGNPGSTVKVLTLGGTMGSVVQKVGEEPEMPIDSKYLLLMNKPPNSIPALIGGTVGARRIDPEATLPSTQDMIDEWHGVCDEYL